MDASYSDMYNYDDNTSDCEQYPGPEFSNGSTVLTVLYYLLFCLGLLGNVTVLWVLLRYIKLKNMTDVCLLNLALSDLMLAVSLPLWAHDPQNLASCRLMTGVYQLGFYSGNLFVTLMSMDRYLAIVHAVAAMRARSLRYGIIASIAIWVVAGIMATPQLIFASLEIEADDPRCEPLYPDDMLQFWKMQRNFSENTVGLFVCLPIMIFCYVKILVVLSRSRNSQKGKAVKLIFIIVCVFVVCWVPYNVIVFLKTLQLFDMMNDCDASKTLNSSMCFAEIIALAHCCVNPVIYAFVGEKFRKSLGKVTARCFCWSYQSRVAFRDTTEKETSNTPVKSDY
ncbi:C-C chemokine receptor type 4 [Pleuronectes platessa]|uniref:C-C chemokine receptor type 4 n=1 Tax=Pleuronectes platessa TaxID=8262 RepID=UPI00232A3296|nr:C-C chemokine receptor type 4 [Pleuronectes platessa]XP_053288592.1 C-C chemokine receptor type 4 [Pleuronectes platessa]XP_053288593.1 C-C chemokine receptor type 4 [Pleuronectes platessa]